MGFGEYRSVVRPAAGAAALVLIVLSTAGAAPDANLGTVDIQSPPISKDVAKTLRSPVPFTKVSISRGQAIFIRNCTGCHGKDGKADAGEVANATDLTSPPLWKDGTAEGEIFHSIRDGAGLAMPAFKAQIHQEKDMWDLVNFIRSLWPASARPALE